MRAGAIEKVRPPPVAQPQICRQIASFESDRIGTRRSILTVISLTFLWYEKYGLARYRFVVLGPAGGILSWATWLVIISSKFQFQARAPVRNLGPGSRTLTIRILA